MASGLVPNMRRTLVTYVTLTRGAQAGVGACSLFVRGRDSTRAGARFERIALVIGGGHRPREKA